MPSSVKGSRPRRSSLSRRGGSKQKSAGKVPSFLPLQHRTAQPLPPDQEIKLVGNLCEFRKQIQSIILPVLEEHAGEETLDHFDQQLAVFQRLRIRFGKRKTVDKLVVKYNEIKHQLVVANLRWVTKVARSHHSSNVAYEDLFQEGVCGLLKAIDRFEASRELRLMTYATWYIREAMQQIRAKQTHTIGMSTHDQTLLGQMEEVKARFQHELQRNPEPKELAKMFDRPIWTIASLQAAALPTMSLDRGSVDFGFDLPTEDPINEYANSESVKQIVGKLLDTLPTRERTVVARRFGLDGYDPDSLEGLGEELQVSKERVRQIQREAIRRMQEEADRVGLGV